MNFRAASESCPPIVLVFGGSDPTGSSGIQACIETLCSHSCHPATAVTAVTVQDSEDFHGYAPLDPEIIIEQGRAVLEDMPVSAILVGMLGNTEAVEAVQSILIDYPDVPVITKPTVISDSGTLLTDSDVAEALVSLIVPSTTVLTLNSQDARILSPGADSIEACAMYLLENGSQTVLITGSRENTSNIVNCLFANEQPVHRYQCERLPYSFHGAGCTLSSSIAGMVAHGLDLDHAVKEAQEYTFNSLKKATRIGMGRHVPNRFFWFSSSENQPEQSEEPEEEL